MPKRKRNDTKELQQDDSRLLASADDRNDNIKTYEISSDTVSKPILCEHHGSQDAKPSLIFTHGAGGGIEAPATRDFARGFGSISPIISFQGNLNLQSRIKAFHTVISHSTPKPVVLGGRSMGARAAVLTALDCIAEDNPVDALVLVSWPLMAGKKGENREFERREKPLIDLLESVDVLFIGGDRDAQCDLEQFEEVRGKMKARWWFVRVIGADHGMGMKDEVAAREMRMKTGQIAAKWVEDRDRMKAYCEIKWDGEEGKVVCGEWQANQS